MVQSNEPTLEQMNEAIAVFMGIKKNDGAVDYFELPDGFQVESASYLQYHTSWSWLMPVVEKIENLYEGNAFTIEIKGNWCLISQNTQHWMAYGNQINLEDIQVKGETKLKAVHKAAYQFIQWLNQQKQKDGSSSES